MRRGQGVAAVFLACMLVAVGGCSFTPERAVLEEVRRLGEAWVQTPVDWTSVEVLQEPQIKGRTFALVAFVRAEKSGQRSQCVFVYEAVHRVAGWAVGGGGGGCGPAVEEEPGWILAGPAERRDRAGDTGIVSRDAESGPGAQPSLPIWLGSGQNSSMGGDAWSRVSGLVYDDQIARAEVVWEDGAVQEADVVRGSVLAIRLGAHRYTEVRGVDAEGTVVHVHEQPEGATGKPEP